MIFFFRDLVSWWGWGKIKKIIKMVEDDVEEDTDDVDEKDDGMMVVRR